MSKTFGGTIRFSTPLGKFSVRGSVTHNPISASYEGIVSHDGSVDRSAKPEGFRFSLDLANRTTDNQPLPLADLFSLEGVSFTLMHDTEKMNRVYSKAVLTGDPQVDDSNGTISGISGIAAGYLETAVG